MPRKSTGEYPPNWKEIAQAVKDQASWKCIRIGRERDDMSRVCPICGRFVLGADRKRSRRMK